MAVLYFAHAVAYNMDPIVTWNYAHIANGQVIKRLLKVNAETRRETPTIVTSEELMTSGGP